MSFVCNINGLCRCCHSQGSFKSLGVPYNFEGNEEIYTVLLRETFDINIIPMSGKDGASTYTICSFCVPKLRDAAHFKKQVLACEGKFDSYYKEILIKDLKVEQNITDDYKSFQDIELNDNHYNDGDDIKQELVIDDDQPLSTFATKKCEQNNDEIITKQTQLNNKRKNVQKYKCNLCSRKFSYNGSLELHLKSHSGEKTYDCILCKESFKVNKLLTKHIEEIHKKEDAFPCTLCTEVLLKPGQFKNHLGTHFSQHKCAECQKSFQRKKGLKEHMKTHTGERKYSCNICHKSFGHNHILKSHMFTHTGEKPYICDICGRGFPQRSHLKRHVLIIHGGQKPYTCNICKKQFSSKSYLLIHERQHTGLKPFSCDVCSKEFTAYTTLKVHMRVHTGLKPYKCSFCNRQFAQQASFKLHERTHTGEKPYGCDICKKRFNDNGYLKIHMRVHTGAKPYACHICKRSFSETGQLKRHMRVHTGVKPYTCKICNKQISHLSKHMRIHTENKSYSCNICNKQFNVSGNLKIHMRLHMGENEVSK